MQDAISCKRCNDITVFDFIYCRVIYPSLYQTWERLYFIITKQIVKSKRNMLVRYTHVRLCNTLCLIEIRLENLQPWRNLFDLFYLNLGYKTLFKHTEYNVKILTNKCLKAGNGVLTWKYSKPTLTNFFQVYTRFLLSLCVLNFT